MIRKTKQNNLYFCDFKIKESDYLNERKYKVREKRKYAMKNSVKKLFLTRGLG